MNEIKTISTLRANPHSHLFTVRIWAEVSPQGIVMWRGKVQHVPSGAWRYFRGWEVLATFLQGQVEEFAIGTQLRVDE